MQRVRDLDPACTLTQVLVLQFAHCDKVTSPWLDQACRNWNQPILVALAASNANLSACQVDVFYAPYSGFPDQDPLAKADYPSAAAIRDRRIHRGALQPLLSSPNGEVPTHARVAAITDIVELPDLPDLSDPNSVEAWRDAITQMSYEKGLEHGHQPP
ncbi:MAG TPA: hypothetical protein VIV60_14460 [Polyangiaceae bacterium]